MASAVRKRSGKYDDNEKTKQTRSSKQSVPRHGDAYLFQPIQGFCLTNFFYALRMIIVIYQRIFLGFQSKLSFTHTQSTLDMSIHRREFFVVVANPEWDTRRVPTSKQTRAVPTPVTLPRRNRFGKGKRTGGSVPTPFLFSYKRENKR